MNKTTKLPNEKIIAVSDLIKNGYTYYEIKKLINQKKLFKLNSRYVKNLTIDNEVSQWDYASAYAPNGIVCLMSAAVLYQLTTSQLYTIEIAIEESSKIKSLPEWPPLEIRYFNKVRYKTGISEIIVDGSFIQIYDIEKTVVDIISFRNKIGIEETKEILKNYLGRPERNVNKLMRYSKILKCNKVLETYLEVLL